MRLLQAQSDRTNTDKKKDFDKFNLANVTLANKRLRQAQSDRSNTDKKKDFDKFSLKNLTLIINYCAVRLSL